MRKPVEWMPPRVVWLALALYLAAATASASCPSGIGSGSSTLDPCVITTCAELEEMSDDLSADYALTDEVNCAGYSDFIPVGTSGAPFTGSLVGNGNNISSLQVTCDSDYCGLFGYLENAQVLGVVLEGVSVPGAGYDYVGGLAGVAEDSDIDGVGVTGSVTGDSQVGGVVGELLSTNPAYVNRTLSDVTVTGSTNVGGIAGRLSTDYIILNSYSSGAILLTSSGVAGGIAGYSLDRIQSCYSTAQVGVTGVHTGTVGGIAGYSSGDVLDSFATGSMAGSVEGGVVGENTASGSLSGCYFNSHSGNAPNCVGDNSGTVECTAVDDNLGYFEDGDLTSPQSSWDFTKVWVRGSLPRLRWEGIGWSYSGGGTVASPYLITDCFELQKIGDLPDGKYLKVANHINCTNSAFWNSGYGFDPLDDYYFHLNGNNKIVDLLFINRSSDINVGFIGDIQTSSASEVEYLGFTNIFVNGSDNVGAFVGYAPTGVNLTQVFAEGYVQADSDVGGLCGYGNCYITDSYFNGDVVGPNTYIGGLAGQSYAAMSYSYASGTVNGVVSSGTVGGVAGYSVTKITDCFSAATITHSGSEAAGILGVSDPPFTVLANCVWYDGSGDDAADCCLGTSAEREACNSASECVSTVTFSDLTDDVSTTMGGWDWANVWTPRTDDLPTLQWVSESGPDCPASMAGSGTQASPCQITSCTQLEAVADELGFYYELADDIDCLESKTWHGGAGFDPIGNDSLVFSGGFFGRDKAVKNLTVYRPSTSFAGLFANVGGDAYVGDFAMADANVTGSDYTGAVAGHSSNWVRNVSVTGTLRGGLNTGGVVGAGNVTYCISNVNVTCTDDECGGLVGYGKVANSSSAGLVTGTATVGGVAGSSTLIMDSYSTANVSGSTYVGGLVGYAHADFDVNKSYSSGKVTCTSDYCGGLVGYCAGRIYDCFTTSQMSYSGSHVGALTGDVVQSLDNNYYLDQTGNPGECYSGGNTGCTAVDNPGYFDDGPYTQPQKGWDFEETWVRGSHPTHIWRSGGYSLAGAGTVSDPWQVSDCFELQYIGNDTADYYLITSDMNCSNTENWNDGDGFNPLDAFEGIILGGGKDIDRLYISRTAKDGVGLVGVSAGGTRIENLSVTNSFVAGRDNVGGLVGRLVGYMNLTGVSFTGYVGGYVNVGLLGGFGDFAVTDSYSNGTVEVVSLNGGGLIGNSSGIISSSYSTGRLVGGGSQCVGGLVGNNTADIHNSFTTMKVSSTGNYVGGAIGCHDPSGDDIDTTYWYNWGSDDASSCCGFDSGNECSPGCITFDDIDDYKSDVYPAIEPMDTWPFFDVWSELLDGHPVHSWEEGADDIVEYTCPNSMDGYGTSSVPCNITSCADLQAMGDDRTLYYQIINYVNCDGFDSGDVYGFLPIGSSGSGFSGVLEGNGHWVGNLSMNRPGTSFLALVENLTSGTVRNLSLVDALIYGDSNVSGVAGVCDSSLIEYVFVNGTISASDTAGAVAATVGQGCVINVTYSSAEVSGSNDIGGIAGRVYGVLDNTYFTGIASGDNVAGVAAHVFNSGVVDHSYFSGTLQTPGALKNAGGVVNHNENMVRNSFNAGVIPSGVSAGSIVYDNDGGTVSDCYGYDDGNGFSCRFYGDPVTCELYPLASYFDDGAYVAPMDLWDFTSVWRRGSLPVFVHQEGGWSFSGDGDDNSPYQISDCFELQQVNDSLGSVYELTQDIECTHSYYWASGRGFQPIGGSANLPSSAFSGKIYGDNHKVTGLYINTSSDYTGFFGYADGATVYNLGLEYVNVTSEYRYVGGLAGRCDSCVVNETFVTGEVTSHTSSGNWVGGLVGYLSDSTVLNSYVSANVSGNGAVGGFIGEATGSSEVNDSFSSGTVGFSNTGNHGGFIGVLSGGELTGCFTDSEIRGASDLGCFLDSHTGGTLTDCYWLDRNGGLSCSSSGAVAGCSSHDELRIFQGDVYPVYEPMSSWDFTDFWDEVSGSEPHLSWEGVGGDLTEYPCAYGMEGYGTAEFPCEIDECVELENMSYRPDFHYLLIDDIPCEDTQLGTWRSGENFLPVGSSSQPFTGWLNGSGYNITGLKVEGTITLGQRGLFGYVVSGNITGVGLIDADILGADDTGGLAGYLEDAFVNDSFVLGDVEGELGTGGLVGRCVGECDILNSYFSGDVSGTEKVGGLVGYDSTNVYRCYSEGSVTGSVYRIGGLIGEVTSGTVNQSYSNASVNGGSYIGGLIGSSNPSVVSDCYARGDVSGGDRSAGLIGWANSNSFVKNSYASGSVDGTGRAGGLISYAISTEVNDTFSTGSVTSPGTAGGHIGQIQNSVRFQNMWWVDHVGDSVSDCIGMAIGEDNCTSVSSESVFYDGEYVQPLRNWDFVNVWRRGSLPVLRWQTNAGWSFEGAGTEADPYNVTDCYELARMEGDRSAWYQLKNDVNCSATIYWNDSQGFDPVGKGTDTFTGTLDGRGFNVTDLYMNWPSADYVGVIAATVSPAKIFDVGVNGVNITGRNYVGAIAGAVNTFTNYTHATGEVKGENRVGCIVGHSSNTMDYSYSDCYVYGDYWVGGVGGSTVDVAKSYSLGLVNGTTYVGGVAGQSKNVTDSYSNANVTGVSYVGGLIGILSSSSTAAYTFASGDVLGKASSDRVGGLVGSADTTTRINYSFSAGQVTGNTAVGALVGYDTGAILVTDSYFYDPGTLDCVGSTSSSTIECTQVADASYFKDDVYDVFPPFDSWGFFDVWGEVADDFPHLIWEGVGGDYENFPCPGTMRGYGIASNPCNVSTCAELEDVGENLTMVYQVVDDIDCYGSNAWDGGAGFDPIGDDTNEFVGSFDGLTHVVSNLSIYRPSTNKVGLFANVAAGANISNINLADANVTGLDYTGAVAGYAEDWISNVSVTGMVAGNAYVGGALGAGNVTFADSGVNVSAVSQVGGVLGRGKAINSSSSGIVDASSTMVGGLLGYAELVKDSYSTANVSGTTRVGGLVGYLANGRDVNRSYSSGYVDCSVNYCGGLVGEAAGKIFDSYSVSKMEYTANSGNLVGDNSLGSITNSYYLNQSDNPDNCYIGGDAGCTSVDNMEYFYDAQLISPQYYWDFENVWKRGSLPIHMWQHGGWSWEGQGTEADPYNISDCYELAKMEGDRSAVYQLVNDTNCSNSRNYNLSQGFDPVGNQATAFTGSFNGRGYNITDLFMYWPSTSWVGLFASVSSDAEIYDLGLNGVNVTGNLYTAALFGQGNAYVNRTHVVGEVHGSDYVGCIIGSGYGRLDYSYTDCLVEGTNNVGGMAGLGFPHKSYSLGLVNGSQKVGGLAGMSSNISDSYSHANVSADTVCGGIVGNLLTDGDVDNSYSTGYIVGNSRCGGIAGYANSGASVNDSFSASDIQSSTETGGVVGYGESDISVVNSRFYQSGSWDCVGQTTSTDIECAEQQDTGYFKGDVYLTYEPMASWGFYSLWEELEDDYPRLAWEGMGGVLENLTRCQNLTESQTYRVKDNITAGAGNCIVVSADDVTIEGAGRYVLGGANDYWGVFADNVDNLRINDLNLKGFGASSNGGGLYLNRTTDSVVSNVTSFHNLLGLYDHMSTRLVLNRSRVGENRLVGVLLNATSASRLLEDDIANNTVGLKIVSSADGNVFQNNRLENNTAYQILDDSGSGDNYLVYNNSWGQIMWVGEDFRRNLSMKGNISRATYVRIANNSAYVNSTYYGVEDINSQANITLYGVDMWGLVRPVIYRDLLACPDCVNFTSLAASTVRFNVSEFSRYRIYDAPDEVPPVAGYVDPTPANNSRRWENSIYVNASSSDELGVHTVLLDLNHSLLGWWMLESMDSNSFENYVDGPNCSCIRCPDQSIEGRRGGSFFFNSSHQDRLNCTNSSSGAFSQFTVLAWAKLSQGDSATLVSKGDPASGHRGFDVYIFDTDRVGLRVGTGSSSVSANSSSGAVPRSSFNHIAAVFSSQGLTVYVDSAKVAENLGSYLLADNQDILRIGSSDGAGFFEGFVDDVAFFSRALSEDEIKSAFDAQSTHYSREFEDLDNGTYDLRLFTQDMGANVNLTYYRITVNTTVNPPGLSNLLVDDSSADQQVLVCEMPNVNSTLTRETRGLSHWWFTYNDSLANVTTVSTSGVHQLLWARTCSLLGNYSVKAHVNDTDGTVTDSQPLWVNFYTTTTTLNIPPGVSNLRVNNSAASSQVAVECWQLPVDVTVSENTYPLSHWWFTYNGTLANITAVSSGGDKRLLWARTCSLAGNYSVKAYVNDSRDQVTVTSGKWVYFNQTTTTSGGGGGRGKATTTRKPTTTTRPPTTTTKKPTTTTAAPTTTSSAPTTTTLTTTTVMSVTTTTTLSGQQTTTSTTLVNGTTSTTLVNGTTSTTLVNGTTSTTLVNGTTTTTLVNGTTTTLVNGTTTTTLVNGTTSTTLANGTTSTTLANGTSTTSPSQTTLAESTVQQTTVTSRPTSTPPATQDDGTGQRDQDGSGEDDDEGSGFEPSASRDTGQSSDAGLTYTQAKKKQEPLSLELKVDRQRYAQAGEEVELETTLLSNYDVYGIRAEVEADRGLKALDEDVVVDLVKDESKKLYFRIRTDEDLKPGQYTVKAMVSDDKGTVQTEAVTLVVVEKPVEIPIVNIQVPGPRVVQDKIYYVSRKMVSVVYTSTNIFMASALSLLALAYVYKRHRELTKPLM